MIIWIQRGHKWFESETEIATVDGFATVPCYRTCMIPGLVVSTSGAGKWTLTHEPTGLSVLGPEEFAFSILSDAVECAEKYGQGINWTVPVPTEEMREAHDDIFDTAYFRSQELDDMDDEE